MPVANTLPDVNSDEILAQLDDDTRAYQVLLNAAGAAFDDEATGGVEYGQTAAQDLRETFKRFEPTARYGNKLTRLLARRRGNIRRVIHNFQEFSTALADATASWPRWSTRPTPTSRPSRPRRPPCARRCSCSRARSTRPRPRSRRRGAGL